MSGTHRAIAAIKKQLGPKLCIMGHHYQNDAVVRHCDIVGDSLELARRVPDVDAAHIVFCGVYFMGESAALLTRPGQGVHLPDPDADCIMSRMSPAPLARKVLEQLSATGRKVLPLAYVNTTVALKAVVGEYGGAVCTSANAATMLRWALEQSDSVLFLPDKNLGENTANALGLDKSQRHVLRLCSRGLQDPAAPEQARKLLLWPGCCAIHARFKPQDVARMRAAHPGCRIIAHPECRQEVINACDGAGSTSFLIQEAARVAATMPSAPLVIGTENNLVQRLAKRHPDCRILSLGQALCPDMAKVTEEKLLQQLERIVSATAVPLEVPPALLAPARLSLTRMLDACARLP